MSRTRGTEAEDRAADFLLAKGYTLLRRRYKAREGEIDRAVDHAPKGALRVEEQLDGQLRRVFDLERLEPARAGLAVGQPPRLAQARGGLLTVEWAGGDAHVRMTGPAETVYEGELEL